jgi:hypothetical protein
MIKPTITLANNMAFEYRNNISNGYACRIFRVTLSQTTVDTEHPGCTGRRPLGMLSRPPAGFSEPLPTVSACHWRENTLERICTAQVDLVYCEMTNWPRQGPHSPRSAHFLPVGVTSERGRREGTEKRPT